MYVPDHDQQTVTLGLEKIKSANIFVTLGWGKLGASTEYCIRLMDARAWRSSLLLEMAGAKSQEQR